MCCGFSLLLLCGIPLYEYDVVCSCSLVDEHLGSVQLLVITDKNGANILMYILW